MLNSRVQLFIFWIVNIAAAIFFYYTTSDLGRMRTYFLNTSYYFFVVLFLLWISAIIVYLKRNKDKISELIKTNRTGLLLSLFITIIIFTSVPCGLKVLADESNVMSVSKSMVFQKKVGNVLEGLWYYNNFYPLGEEIELRPLTLPFFVHIIHAITGYRVANVFVVNFILLFIFLSIVHIVTRKYWGIFWAIAMQFFIVAQPLIAQLATSGGIDFIYMVFFTISLLCLYIYIKQQTSEALLLLVANLLLFANTRYEAIFQMVIILLLLFILKKIKWENVKPNLVIYSFIPLLMLPSLWQRIFKFKDNELPVNKAASIGNSISNTKLYITSMFDFSNDLPYANAINIFSLVAIIVFIIYLVRKKITFNPNRKAFAVILTVCLVSMWMIITIFSVSLANHPSQSRLFLVFTICSSVFAAWALYQVNFIKERSYIAVVISILCFIFYLPNAAENRFVNKQSIVRENNFVLNFFKSEPNNNFVVIDVHPGLYTIYNYGGISFERANGNPGLVLTNLSRHLYKKVYVVQEIAYLDMRPIKNCELNSAYILRPVTELQNSPESFLRISEISLTTDK